MLHYYILNYKNFKADFCSLPYSTVCDYDVVNTFNSRKVGQSQNHIAGAPTQSILQRWIRDNHGISVNALPNANGWKYRIDLIKNYMNMCNSGENYSSYEEALEAGLLIALQMI